MSPARPSLLAAPILLPVPTRLDSAGAPFPPPATPAGLALARADPPMSPLDKLEKNNCSCATSVSYDFAIHVNMPLIVFNFCVFQI